MLMTAHVVYPALDRKRAATVSPKIVGRLLRDNLDFKGIVAGDDLHMRAISGTRTIVEAAVESLAAGVDQLLVCHDLGEAKKVVDGVIAAVVAGALDRSAVIDASMRVHKMASRHRRRRPAPCRLPNRSHRLLVRDLLRV
jgi:beta-N-acetylhexosaminidase